MINGKAKQPTKVLVATLTTHERTGWPHKSIMEWFQGIPMREKDHDFAVGLATMHNYVPAASARNNACQVFKSHPDMEWLCFIDNDMVIPDNLLDTIRDVPKDAAVVVPVFYLWDETNHIPNLTLCWGTEKQTNSRNELLGTPDLKELMKAGTGVMFIRRSVVETIPEPWFWYTYGEDQGMRGTEDINFCMKVRGYGLKIYGNPKVEIGHYKSVDLLKLSRLVYGVAEEKVSGEASAASPDQSSLEESPSHGSVVAASPAR